MKNKIGFIGLGAMGRPMAENFIKAGYETTVYDVVPAAMDALSALGAHQAKSPKETAAVSDVLFTSLPNGAIVEQIMCGEQGVFAGAKAGTIVVDLSSVSPELSKKMSEHAKETKLFYLDAPVSGGVAGAKAGTLTLMVGGDKEIYEELMPIWNCIGKNIFYIGGIGSGDAMKLVNNLMLGCNMAALSEALCLGARCGLDLHTMQTIIAISSGRSYASDAKLEKFIVPEQFDGGFAVALQHKDLHLAMEAAKDCGMPLPMASCAAQIYEMAKADDLGKKDISVLTKMWSEMTGTKLS